MGVHPSQIKEREPEHKPDYTLPIARSGEQQFACVLRNRSGQDSGEIDNGQGSASSHCSDAVCFNYGGGRQTAAMCILIAKGVLPKPDCITMADTSREMPTTWQYLDEYTQPLMRSIGLEIEIASHDLATVDTHGHNGQLLLPVYTPTGKFSGYCSGEWKRDVVERYRKRVMGIKGGTIWLGLAFDESRRWKRAMGTERHGFRVECPLVEMRLTTEDCLKIIRDFGWPEPSVSRCWMCPNQRNEEWRQVRDDYPELFQLAIELDEEEREADDRGGVYLHRSKVPLREADLSGDESRDTAKQCGLGMCFV